MVWRGSDFLMIKKQTHSKMDKLIYCTFEMQDYYKVNKLSAVFFLYITHIAYYLDNIALKLFHFIKKMRFYDN